MENIPVLREMAKARVEGRHEDALLLLKEMFDEVADGKPRFQAQHFATMFEWSLLVEEYAPAKAALASVRDEQVRLVLDGDNIFGDRDTPWPRSRFQNIVNMNETLKESSATYELFLQLLSSAPELARTEAFMAMPAVVEAGDFALAERFIKDPLGRLDEINQHARDLPLFPPAPGWTPRLMGELMNFTKDVILRSTALHGLGREAEAEALRNAALSGLESEEIRALVQRELTVPGTINRELSERRM